jgi:D-methionine transport system permease protein
MQIMLAVIVVLIILVMLIQATGDTLANQLDKRKI